MICATRTIAAAVLALGVLSGCMAGSIAVSGVEMASYINTDKSLFDHAASAFTGLDCSSIRSANGDSYCEEPYDPSKAPPPVYCYRSLGAITCYDRPDLYGDDAKQVD